jgi:hypothetical protein
MMKSNLGFSEVSPGSNSYKMPNKAFYNVCVECNMVVLCDRAIKQKEFAVEAIEVDQVRDSKIATWSE